MDIAANNNSKKWLLRLDSSRRWRKHQSCSHRSTSSRFDWKYINAVFGFALTIILTLIDIKYQSKPGELFGNHGVAIFLSLSAMLVAVSASMVLKFLHGLLPRWARFILSRLCVFCAFQTLFMLGSVLIFEKTPLFGLVFCVFPAILIWFPNRFKQVGVRGWSCWLWLTAKLASVYKLISGREEQSPNNKTRLPS